MINWIKKNLDYKKKGYENVEGELVDSFSFLNREGNRTITSVDFFTNKFGKVKPEKVDDLINKDVDDILGWHKHFDFWEEQGMFN